MNKPKIFLSVMTYLPGYRGGGPIQSIKNLVESLSDKFEFYIFTANHDLGIKKPYEDIITDQWQTHKGINIFYSSEVNKNKNLKKIFTTKSFSLIFLNSFFHTDTIRILFIRKQLKLDTPLILMPRGELSEGALDIKNLKKMIYIKTVKKTGILNQINYLTTAQDEYNQVKKILSTDKVHKVSNIPNTEKKITLNTKNDRKLKVVFLSRITQKKNLDYALKTLHKCEENIEFDIYGTLEEKKYWEKCQDIIKTLPKNIRVTYKGELTNDKVISTLSMYDLFYFPTRSENYGHVISESLQASLPTLISNTTPWDKLNENKMGWVFSLNDPQLFSEKIDQLARYDLKTHNNMKKLIYKDFDVLSRVNNEARGYIKIINKIL